MPRQRIRSRLRDILFEGYETYLPDDVKVHADKAVCYIDRGAGVVSKRADEFLDGGKARGHRKVESAKDRFDRLKEEASFGLLKSQKSKERQKKFAGFLKK